MTDTPVWDGRPLFARASYEELKEADFDPKWIPEDWNGEGPYAPIRVFDEACPCCGGTTSGWTVLDLSRATGISEVWTHEEAETEAHECATKLNAVWLAGYAAREVPAEVSAREREAELRGFEAAINFLAAYTSTACFYVDVLSHELSRRRSEERT